MFCVGDSTSSLTLIGTPEFMAPEVMLGAEQTKAVDYWSLGAVVCEM